MIASPGGGSTILLMVPPSAPTIESPLPAIARSTARLVRLAAIAGGPASPTGSMVTDPVLRAAGELLLAELPALGAALRHLCRKVEGALLIGDPRAGALERLACHIDRVTLFAEAIGEAVADRPEGEYPVGELASLAHRLETVLRPVRLFLLPLADSRLQPRDLADLATASPADPASG